MRARRGIALGWLVVGLYGAALVGAAATARDGVLRPGDRPDDGTAAQAFADAWDRSRRATFVRFGTFERRSEVTGAVITSEDVLAQRPPRRIHRQLGGVEGRDDDRVVTCPSAPPGQASSGCFLGEPAGPSYDESVAAELDGLRSILGGSSPLYAVARGSDTGCFDLAQRRVDPRAPFGIEARFCFDPSTGAPAGSRVRYEGGIVEVLAVTEIRAVVTDADLEP
jgi:hypothetical protein